MTRDPPSNKTAITPTKRQIVLVRISRSFGEEAPRGQMASAGGASEMPDHSIADEERKRREIRADARGEIVVVLIREKRAGPAFSNLRLPVEAIEFWIPLRRVAKGAIVLHARCAARYGCWRRARSRGRKIGVCFSPTSA